MSRFHRGISGFILRRVLLGLLTLFLVSLVVFAATQALPSDPARAILGRTATPDSLKALREQLNLNHSAVSQYGHWLGGIFTGDLGNSLASNYACATQTNLGQMVANPADLVSGQPLGPAAGAPAVAAVQRYMTDRVKAYPSSSIVGGGGGGGGGGGAPAGSSDSTGSQ